MAHVKAGGTAKNVRDSQSKRLGVKLFGGESVTAGQIIVRQRGTKMTAGTGTKVGKDHTIHAAVTGKVKFAVKQRTRYSGGSKRRTEVSVEA